MLKKKWFFRMLPVLLLLFLVSTTMMSGTFAKYASEYSGQDTALVARWSFTGQFDDVNLSGTDVNLPIWDHTYVTNIYDLAGNNDLIAPGVQGSFKVEFSYDADVDADLTFDFTKSGNASGEVPIQYSIDNFTTIYYSLDELENAIIATATTASTSTITGADGTYIVTDTAEGGTPGDPISINVTVSWRWPYAAGDHNAFIPDAVGEPVLNGTGIAYKRAAEGFVGTGAEQQAADAGNGLIQINEWSDADDTLIGNSSATAGILNRDDYILDLEIKAVQRVPAE